MTSNRRNTTYNRSDYVRGSAVPADKTHEDRYEHDEYEQNNYDAIRAARLKQERQRKNATRPPVLAVLGVSIIGVLMIMVIVEHINYSEVAREVAGLNAEIRALQEQERRLGIQLESVVNMHDVERFARDILGMSNPEGETAVIRGNTHDRVVIVQYGVNERGLLSRFSAFISTAISSVR